MLSPHYLLIFRPKPRSRVFWGVNCCLIIWNGCSTWGAHVSFGCPAQILQPSICDLKQCPAVPWTHCDRKLLRGACQLWSLGDALVAGVAVSNLLITMKQSVSGRQ